MVGFDSWRADGLGNEVGRNLATKSTLGGRAIRQAVTCVKPEQASKAAMWTPTRRKTGEGSTDGEEPGAGARCHDNHRAPVRSTGVVGTACRKGKAASVGEARSGRRSRDRQTTLKQVTSHLGVGEGQMYLRSRVIAAEGRTLTSGVFGKEERTGD